MNKEYSKLIAAANKRNDKTLDSMLFLMNVIDDVSKKDEPIVEFINSIVTVSMLDFHTSTEIYNHALKNEFDGSIKLLGNHLRKMFHRAKKNNVYGYNLKLL